MILSWLLDTNEKVGLDYQVEKYFDHQMIAFKDVVKKVKISQMWMFIKFVNMQLKMP